MPQDDAFPGLTIQEMKDADPDRADVALDIWTPGDKYIDIGWEESIRTSIRNRDWEAGPPEWLLSLDTPVDARLYGGSSLGGALHGVDVNVDGEWKEVFYETPREQELRHAEYMARSDRKRREEFAEQRDDLDARFEKLPYLFQQRIARRRQNNPSFRLDWEPYELFCCEQAVVFAERALMAVGAPEVEIWKEPNDHRQHVNSQSEQEAEKDKAYGWPRGPDGHLAGEATAQRASEWLIGWAMIHSNETPDKEEVGEDWGGWEALNQRTKDYDIGTLKKLMPEYTAGEHSGNTFGVALKLGRLYLTRPDGVIDMHGAGAAISGSEEYGDFPQEPSSDELLQNGDGDEPNEEADSSAANTMGEVDSREEGT